MKNKELMELRRSVSSRRRQFRRDRKTGRDTAAMLLRKVRRVSDGHRPTDRMANILASLILDFTKSEPDDACRKLLLERTFERYWAAMVQVYLKPYRQLYSQLVQGGHTAVNPLVWGDIDCGAWFESSEDRSIIALEVYCACRCDNTYLYILEDRKRWVKFHCRMVWPRIKRALPGKGWDYVEQASMRLYRDQGFKLKYGDARDPGYCFTYESLFSDGKVDNAYYHGGDIYWALWYLDSLGQALDDRDEQGGEKDKPDAD